MIHLIIDYQFDQYCKVMESIIRDHIMDFFFQNNYFSKNQFGFIKGRSTALQLLRITDEWTTQTMGAKLMSYTLILLKRLTRSLIVGY